VSEGERLFADVNPYQYLTGTSDAPGDVAAAARALFAALAERQVSGVVWNVSAAGKALYRTRAATPFEKDPHAAGRRLEAALDGVDLLEAACQAAREEGLEIHAGVRVYDDYFPGLGSRFEAEHQEMLWESRDGEFRLRGVLCMAYEAVAEYRLACVEEVARYGAAGVVIDLETTAAASTPFRRRDFFGFNAPLAQAHLARTGEDIRRFDDAVYSRGTDLQVVDARYEGGAFDRQAWHAVKGEAFEAFLRRAAEVVRKAGQRVGLARGREEGPLPMARHALAAERWLSEGLIDDLYVTRGTAEEWTATAPPGGRLITASGENGYRIAPLSRILAEEVLE
jgi:hypothetical protein